MKKLLKIPVLLFVTSVLISFNSFGQKEKIYGSWESQYSEVGEGDGFEFKATVEETTQYLRGGRINAEGTMLFEYDWNDEETQNFVGSRFKISYFSSGSWSVEDNFLITTYENINPMIDDEYGIQFVNPDELDESEKVRMEMYMNLIDFLKNMQGFSDEAEIITLKNDVMVLKSDNTFVTYTKVNN